MDYSARLTRLREEMRQQEIDLVLLTPSTDLIYLTGIRERMMERLVLLAVDQREAHFIAPDFETKNLGAEARALLNVHGWADGQDPFAVVDRLLPAGAQRAAAGRQIPGWLLLGIMGLRPSWQWEVADRLLVGMRSVKDQEERRLLKEAQEGSCRAFLKLLEHPFLGKTELEISKLLAELVSREGMEIGRPIVASGPNGALPHHHPGQRVIEEGDAVVIDFGGYFPAAGYQADTTRTVCVKRMPEGFREVYDITLEANRAAAQAARPGIPCEAVDKAARDVITAAGYGEYFTHRLGHGLGLDTHENPYISAGNKELLREGNSFSDEPGIYLPGRFGVRIEDQLLLHADGAERLTPLGHDPLIVD